ncbi:hypothetical protein MHTCC0001_07400 [Flavobacteriaceae bacterium MHTCC 0001]
MLSLGHAQCTVSAGSFGNNTVNLPMSYEVMGDVSVVLNDNNTVTLNLGSNFSTANGPDVRVYLVASNGLSTAQLQNTEIANLTHIEFGLVGCDGCVPAIPSNGAKSFTVPIPTNQNISSYDKVFFYCLQFNAFWDVGSFTPFTSANCSVLDVNDVLETTTDFKIYPNPVQDNLTIENNNSLPITATIFNVLGKEILKINDINHSKIKINLSTLKAGVYLLQTTFNNTTTTKRLIKQ